MRKQLLIIAIAAALLALASPALASPAYVQSASGSTSGTSLGVSYTSNVAAGDLLVGQFRTTGTTSVSDSVNGAWTKAVETTSEGVTHSIWYRTNAAAGKTTVTVKAGASGSIRAVMSEDSGVATGTNALDGSSCNQGTGTSVTTGSSGVSNAGDLLYAAVGMFEHPRTITAGSSNGTSATLRTQFSGEFGTSGEEDLTAAAGAQNASFTLSEAAPSGWAACAASFLPEIAEASAPACTKYASTTASGTENGEKAHPYKTVLALAEHLSPGQVGCLHEGQTFSPKSQVVFPVAVKGEKNKPVTIESENVNNPATMNFAFIVLGNYVTFTHLKMYWEMPKPWACIDSEGEIIKGEVLTFPRNGGCEKGTPNPEDFPQVEIYGEHDSFTYDDVSNEQTSICLLPEGLGGEAKATETLIEHDRIHDCGPTVITPAEGGRPAINEEPGWHDHGVYDEGQKTIIKNNYIYRASRNGVLNWTPTTGASITHNVIDRNGNGWTVSSAAKGHTFAWNTSTNSYAPAEVADSGIRSESPAGENTAENVLLYGNLSSPEVFESGTNKLKKTNVKEATNPEYVCGTCTGATPDYRLKPAYAVEGFGPQSPPTKY